MRSQFNSKMLSHCHLKLIFAQKLEESFYIWLSAVTLKPAHQPASSSANSCIVGMFCYSFPIWMYKTIQQCMKKWTHHFLATLGGIDQYPVVDPRHSKVGTFILFFYMVFELYQHILIALKWRGNCFFPFWITITIPIPYTHTNKPWDSPPPPPNFWMFLESTGLPVSELKWTLFFPPGPQNLKYIVSTFQGEVRVNGILLL